MMPYIRLRLPSDLESKLATLCRECQQLSSSPKHFRNLKPYFQKYPNDVELRNHQSFVSQLDPKAGLGSHPFHLTVIGALHNAPGGTAAVDNALQKLVNARTFGPFVVKITGFRVGKRRSSWNSVTTASVRAIVKIRPMDAAETGDIPKHETFAGFAARLQIGLLGGAGQPWYPPYHITIGATFEPEKTAVKYHFLTDIHSTLVSLLTKRAKKAGILNIPFRCDILEFENDEHNRMPPQFKLQSKTLPTKNTASLTSPTTYAPSKGYSGMSGNSKQVHTKSGNGSAGGGGGGKDSPAAPVEPFARCSGARPNSGLSAEGHTFLATEWAFAYEVAKQTGEIDLPRLARVRHHLLRHYGAQHPFDSARSVARAFDHFRRWLNLADDPDGKRFVLCNSGPPCSVNCLSWLD